MKKIFKKIIELILFFIYVTLNIIFIKKKDRIIFISFPDISDNSWHLYKYAVEHLDAYEIVWLVSGDELYFLDKVKKANRLNKNNVKVVRRWSVKGFLLFCNSKIVFHTHGTYFFVKSTFNTPIIVNLWHGMPIKAIGFLDKEQKKDFCYSNFTLATSKKYKEIMAQVFGMPEENVLLTGLPRNDILYTGLDCSEKNKILDKLKIDYKEKILIWLPTYRVSGFGDVRNDAINSSFLDDLESGFLEKLNDLCILNSVKVIVKLHPMDSLNSIITQYNFSNIIFYDATAWRKLNIDLYDVISLSKGVITDFSSVMIDCLPTKIRVGFMSASLLNYNRKTVVSIDNLLESIYEINSPDDFVKMVDEYKVTEFYNLNNMTNFNESKGNACYLILDKFLSNKDSKL